MNNTSSNMFWPSSPPVMVSSARIWYVHPLFSSIVGWTECFFSFRWRNSHRKCRSPKPVVSTGFKLRSRISIRKCTVYLLIPTSKIHANGKTSTASIILQAEPLGHSLLAICCSTLLTHCRTWRRRQIGRSVGWTTRQRSPNDSWPSLVSKAFSSVDLLPRSSGYVNVVWCLVSPSATNWSVEMRFVLCLISDGSLHSEFFIAGFTHWFRLFALRTHRSQAQRWTDRRNPTRCGGDRNRISHRCSSVFTDWHECSSDESIHQIRCWSSTGGTRLLKGRLSDLRPASWVDTHSCL